MLISFKNSMQNWTCKWTLETFLCPLFITKYATSSRLEKDHEKQFRMVMQP
jgi:hypothetical protein